MRGIGVIGAVGGLAATVLLAATPAGSATAGPPESPAGPPRALVIEPRGLAPSLVGPQGPARARVLLARQPLLRALDRGFVEARLAGRGARGPAGAELARGRTLRGLAPVRRRAAAEVADLVGRVRGTGIAILERSPAPASLLVRASAGRLSRLARDPAVQAVWPEPRPRPQLDTAAGTVGAPAMWAAGYHGGSGTADSESGIDVALSSDTPDPTHPAFSGLLVENDRDANDHGTHTGGIVASRDASFRGIAFGIERLYGGNAPADQLLKPDPAELVSESFAGVAVADDANRFADLLADAHKVAYVAGAGNANDDGGSITPGEPTVGNVGHNQLVVGATGDLGTTDPSDDVVAEYSSFGPTPAGRKKPDLTAPGSSIRAPSALWDRDCGGVPGGCPDFTSLSGTSFSTPMVGGAAALLYGAGLTDPRGIRAVLINSADDWCNGHLHDPPSGPPLPPDGTCQTSWLPDVGWGHLDLQRALAEMGNLRLGSVPGGEARFFGATVAPGEKATLAWNLRVEPGRPAFGDEVYYTLTDLDLARYRIDFTPFAPPSDPGYGAGPDAGDRNDNVEQVRGPSGSERELIYKVDAASTVEGASAEPFALAASNPLNPLEPPSVATESLLATPDATTVNCSETVEIRAGFRNSSADLPLEDASVWIELPSGVELASGAPSAALGGGELSPGEVSAVHGWSVRPTESGAHTVSLRAAGGLMDETYERTEQVEVRADCSPPSVEPVEVELAPEGFVQCGTRQVLSARFRNPTATDAPSARATLRVPRGVRLVSKPAEQALSGGVLERGAVTPRHFWAVRQLTESISRRAAILAGLTGTEAVAVRLADFECDSLSTRMGRRIVRRRGRHLLTRARLIPERGATLPLRGRVLIKFVRPGKDVIRIRRVRPNGIFRAGVRACRGGHYRIRARYRGSVGFEPEGGVLARLKLGSRAC